MIDELGQRLSSINNTLFRLNAAGPRLYDAKFTFYE